MVSSHDPPSVGRHRRSGGREVMNSEHLDDSFKRHVFVAVAATALGYIFLIRPLLFGLL